MRTAIKSFEANSSEELYRAASSAIDKAAEKLKVWSTRTKLAVIKHVLQRNLVNQEQYKNRFLRSFFA